MKSGNVKGFRDFVGSEALKRAKIRKVILRQFELYGFEPAETPTIEFEEFVRGDNVNDEAVSDIFKLEDKGKRALALRCEFTFQLKRLAKNQKLPYKRFQIGRVFRDEPVSANRFREFTQCDADVVGSSLKDEAEVLSMVKKILDELGIDSVVYFNNRKLLNEIMVAEGVAEKNREQVIRELDKLDKLSKKEVADALKKLGAESVLKVIDGKLDKFKFYSEVKELEKLCKVYGVKLKFAPTLARGLSYYNGTVFEVKVKGSKDSICGGGAYKVGDVQAFGFAFGLERLCGLSKVEGDVVEVQVISVGEDEVAIGLASKLRESGTSVNLILDKSIGKAMEYADSKGVRRVVFVGKDEVAKGKFKVRDMESGVEKFVGEKGI